MNQDTLVEVKHLKEYFSINTGLFSSKPLKAVDDVSFSIRRGETLGLVGESGCGKTTVGRTLLHLYKPTDGEIWFDGKQIVTKKDIAEYRQKTAMVFQDPYSSLNPRMTVADIIGEPLDVHKMYKSEAERKERILELMAQVGLNSEHANRYAHEFSGGQRQRIGIARALILKPDFIICDEPVSALDVSIQAQILNLMQDLQEQMGLTYIFVTHDLSVVKHISNKIAVMYLGNLVEYSETEELFANPTHPYTRALLASVPTIDLEKAQEIQTIAGEITSPINPKPGCRFAARCPHAMEACFARQPEMHEVSANHFVACHLLDKG